MIVFNSPIMCSIVKGRLFRTKLLMVDLLLLSLIIMRICIVSIFDVFLNGTSLFCRVYNKSLQ